MRLTVDGSPDVGQGGGAAGRRQGAAVGAHAEAVWNGAVIAESDGTVMVEGNHYFPRSAVRSEYLDRSDRATICPWKSTAGYYDVVVDDERNPGAAWYYARPKPEAARIEGTIAFWKGVEVES